MVKEEKSHEIHDFMRQISHEISAEYERIRKRASDDPGTAGDQGEENWAAVLRDWLPQSFTVVTKGRIIGHEGAVSPQIDIIVLKDSYPSKLRDKKLFLAGGVAAAFECKTTLKSQHIIDAIKTCVKVKSLYKTRTGSPYKELHSPIVYGLLAHSHSWKGGNSTPLENVKSKLIEHDGIEVAHPRFILDLICVADLASWRRSITTFFGPAQVPDWSSELATFGPNGSATTAHVEFSGSFENQYENFSPLGTLVFSLSEQLAWERPDLRSMADYYRATKIGGAGTGTMRMWGADIYSEEIRHKVVRGELANGVFWDEWSIHF